MSSTKFIVREKKKWAIDPKNLMLMYLDVDGLSKVYCLTYNSIIFIIMKNNVQSLSLDGKNNSMIRNHLIFGEDFVH